MSFFLALLIAALSGFVALSYEILWFRVYAFVTGATAPGFGVLLGAYLCGIAFGSLMARRACASGRGQLDDRARALPVKVALLAAVAAWSVVPLVARAAGFVNFAATLPLVAGAAGLMGALLPIVSHYGIDPDPRAGSKLSHLYLANIVGSAAGSLLTGFVLLDHLPLHSVALVLGVSGVGLVAVLAFGIGLSARERLRWGGIAAATVAGIAVLQPWAFDRTYERLQWKRTFAGQRFAHVIETRSGVITVDDKGAIFGGGMYDGVFSVDLAPDRNRLARAYALAAVHPRPREVLMVGLASGSWAQVVAAAPGVERVTIVEINPGYLELVGAYPQTASLLKNPKVAIAVDDGRRWLLAHPERKFDAVVQNTTWHWRAQITGILAREYLELLRSHLRPGGVVIWNTTDSVHAQKTGCTVFRHGFRYQNSLYASDSPIALDAGRWRNALAHWRIDGRAVVDAVGRPETAARRDELEVIAAGGPGGADHTYESCASILQRTPNDPVLTDDNMTVEFARPWWAEP
jgi:spermidine synthase